MRILVECYVDTLLIKTLGYVVDEDHSSISNVAYRMKNKYSEERVLGIIDNDSEAVPSYFSEFVEIAQIHAIHFFKHKDRDRYLIKINKDFEDLLFRIETEVKVKHFKAKKNELIDLTKNKAIMKDKKFELHLKSILEAKPSSIGFLKKCIDQAANA